MEMMVEIENSIRSSFIEKMVEHAFVSEILQEAWIRKGKQIEILRAEVDNSGYDIVACCDNVNRYIQLKTSDAGAKTSIQNVNIALVKKENACVVWIIRHPNPGSARYRFSYRFFGAPVGFSFPDTSEFRKAKHSRGNSFGVKNERPNIIRVPRSRFEIINDSEILLRVLFGI